jgi:hypothetical protein
MAQYPGQPSLFGVVATAPTAADLAGLLVAPGALRRMGGTAQVSIEVDAAWRVHALLAELAVRELPGTWEAAGVGYLVRTAFTTRLVPLAGAWEHGPPAGLHLNGPALRLWVAAAGTGSPDGYLLRLGAAEDPDRPAVGAALSAAGLSAALVLPGTAGVAGAPAYRITSRRRLARLAELVGDPPPAAPAEAWPTP